MNNEFKEIEDLLAKADVGSDRYKQTIFNKLKFRMETGTLKTNNNLENNSANKRKIFKPAKVAALVLGAVLVGTGAAYGSQMISEIIQKFKVGNTEIIRYDTDKSKNSLSYGISIETMQEGFKGKLADKNGNELSYSEDQENYEKHAESITILGTEGLTNGNIEHKVSVYTDGDLDVNRVFSINEIKNSVSENVKIPTYLPEGYEFKEGINGFNGESATLIYENEFKDRIDLLMSTNKDVTTGIIFDKNTNIEEKYIDGKRVILAGNGVFWESEGVTYQLYWNSNKDENNSINVEEISKMIESME